MIINDINYLEATNEEVFGGRGVKFDSDITFDKNVNANVFEKIEKVLVTDVSGLEGSVAQVISTSDARGGKAQFTSIISGTEVEDGLSESFTQSVAAISYK
jgi:hypothetical protein